MPIWQNPAVMLPMVESDLQQAERLRPRQSGTVSAIKRHREPEYAAHTHAREKAENREVEFCLAEITEAGDRPNRSASSASAFSRGHTGRRQRAEDHAARCPSQSEKQAMTFLP